jgi:sulfur carrier protein
VNLTINGQQWTVGENATLDAVLADYGVPIRGVAVAVNGTVVPRSDWPSTSLAPNSAVDVLTAVQGG